jgi:hypothetical protein
VHRKVRIDISVGWATRQSPGQTNGGGGDYSKDRQSKRANGRSRDLIMATGRRESQLHGKRQEMTVYNKVEMLGEEKIVAWGIRESHKEMWSS